MSMYDVCSRCGDREQASCHTCQPYGKYGEGLCPTHAKECISLKHDVRPLSSGLWGGDAEALDVELERHFTSKTVLTNKMQKTKNVTQIRISVRFLWRDIWIGVYYEERKLYICVFPMLPIKVEW